MCKPNSRIPHPPVPHTHQLHNSEHLCVPLRQPLTQHSKKAHRRVTPEHHPCHTQQPPPLPYPPLAPDLGPKPALVRLPPVPPTATTKPATSPSLPSIHAQIRSTPPPTTPPPCGHTHPCALLPRPPYPLAPSGQCLTHRSHATTPVTPLRTSPPPPPLLAPTLVRTTPSLPRPPPPPSDPRTNPPCHVNVSASL